MKGGGTYRGRHAQRGSVLAVTLILMLVMALLSVGLVQSSVHTSQTASIKTVDAAAFHAAETCNQEVLSWLRGLSAPPGDDALPHIITRENLEHLMTGAESQQVLNQLAGYSYSCTVTAITSQTVTGDSEGISQDIAVAGGYGAGADVSPRYYYRVSTTADGPMNASKRISAIVSVEF